jgi:aspartyl-tRNA(Asn)/glutamyl-tRNA(Gln) amidotransferase subunit A
MKKKFYKRIADEIHERTGVRKEDVCITRAINYMGLPSVSVPCGFDSKGLPIGFQIQGRPFAEARVLKVAHAYQQDTDWHKRVPLSLP